MPNQGRQTIAECLDGRRLDDLFLEALRWERPSESAHQRTVGAPVNQPVRFQPLAQMGGVPVFRVDWHREKPPTVTERRAVMRKLSATYREHLLVYVAQNRRELLFVWAKPSGSGRNARTELRTLPYTVGEPARTTVERLGLLAFSFDELSQGAISVTAVLDKLDLAFNVEAVTKQFFEEYKSVFYRLHGDLARASGDAQWAHDYSLQFLNRAMFLYFLQRKRWLGNRPDFMRHLWASYLRSRRPADTFYAEWLSPLFFEAFNNRYQAGRSDHGHLPEDIQNALATAPYLNGGLFARNELDEKHPISLPDSLFEALFGSLADPAAGLLERYNFTISESTPLDVEVAVDPEMIGQVYESLVNATAGDEDADVDSRLNAGIFYTPRVEIDLMCRLTLVDCLANRLGEARKPLLYEVVFAHDDEEKADADARLKQQDLWPALDSALAKLTVCDPACGSGSFLVGMLMVLDDLQSRADDKLGRNRTAYQRRHAIIRESLYGVDVMGWAVHVAELRLWLQLVIETEVLTPELRFKPLLPNLSFKVREGDSLVQEIGGVNLNLHRDSTQTDLPAPLKGQLTELKGRKRRFYDGERGLNAEAIRQEERDLFRAILEERRRALDTASKAILSRMADRRLTLTGESVSALTAAEQKRLGAELEEIGAALARVKEAQRALAADPKRVPFVWDLAFPEVFDGDEHGFDIVIGNPPYVRQERIGPPNQPGAPAAERKAYKDKLQLSVWSAYPRFFGYDPRKKVDGKNPKRRLDGKSDLYVYFYFHGLSLLNGKGAFAYITSNSWLDVGYGADLQEFLLRHGRVRMVWDNQNKRSFSQADVNTVIVLLGPADDARSTSPEAVTRFVQARVPFEQMAAAVILQEIEEATVRTTTPEYRVYPLTVAYLLAQGMDPEGPGLRYAGDKWGGKYLRAPDIYFVVLEKGRGKLVPLGSVAEVRPGCYSGINDFFYVSKETANALQLEPECLRPIIRTSRDVHHMHIADADPHHFVFYCPLAKSAMRQRGLHGALEYIAWGERQVTRRRQKTAAGIPWPQTETVKRRSPGWWAIPSPNVEPSHNFLLYVVGDRFLSPWADTAIASDRCFHRLMVSRRLSQPLAMTVNSTLTFLFMSLFGRGNLGQGAQKHETADARRLPVMDPHLLGPSGVWSGVLRDFGRREVLPVRHELAAQDRRLLDDVVLEPLGLTRVERDGLYEAVLDLVEARLNRAESLGARTPSDADPNTDHTDE